MMLFLAGATVGAVLAWCVQKRRLSRPPVIEAKGPVEISRPRVTAILTRDTWRRGKN